MPDEIGRLEILKVHSATMPLDKKVDLKEIAKKTNEYSGADLENLCREAGMFAIRKESSKVILEFFKEAMKVIRPNVTKENVMSVEKFKSTFGAMYG